MGHDITWSIISLKNDKREDNQITLQIRVNAERVTDYSTLALRTDHYGGHGVHKRQEEKQ